MFVFKLRGRVQIGGQNLFAKCVRIGKCSSKRVFESRGTTVPFITLFLINVNFLSVYIGITKLYVACSSCFGMHCVVLHVFN